MKVVLIVFTLAGHHTSCAIFRHRAITKPLNEETSKSTVKGWIAFIWLAAIVLAYPMASFHEFQYVREQDKNGVKPYCTPYGKSHTILSYDFDNSSMNYLDHLDANGNKRVMRPFDIYTIVLSLCQYGIPLTILTILYANMFIKLKSQQTPGNSDESRDKSLQLQRKKSLKMMVTVVILFGVCWLPWHAFHFLQLTGRGFVK